MCLHPGIRRPEPRTSSKIVTRTAADHSSHARARLRARDGCYTPPVAGPILRILTTEVGAEERVLLLGEQPVKLGRADDNDVVLLEQAASRHHARIEPVEGGYDIVDLGSAAGLTLRGTRVTRHHLRDGDELEVGRTRLRFVVQPGSEATLPPPTTPPSSRATEAADDVAPAPLAAPTERTTEPLGERMGEADTLVPEDGGEADAAPADLPPPEPAPRGTVAAPHQPAPAPVAAPPTPRIQPVSNSDQSPHPKSNPSFVFGGGSSSPSDYTLEGQGSPQTGASGGYKLEGSRSGDPIGGLSIDTMPPTALSRGPGAGMYVSFLLLGAAACFGVLTAIQGVPW